MGENYLAGIAPGGLKEVYLVKILICYLLDAVGAPLSAEQMTEIFEVDQVVDYFTFITALEELRSTHLSIVNEADTDKFSLTALGKETADNLSRALPSSLRERVVKQGIILLSRLRKSEEVRVEIVESETGYRVTGTLRDRVLEFFSLSLYAPDREQADILKRNFENKSAGLYQLLLRELAE